MKYIVKIDQRQYEVEINGDQSVVSLNGRWVSVDLKTLHNGRIYSLLADNINYEFQLEKSNGGFDIWHGSNQSYAEVIDEKNLRLKNLMGESGERAKAHSLKAPMPGLVLKIEVSPGQHVKKGDGLVIIEAMKMENELKAHGHGIIKEIKINNGDAVEKNQELIIFE